MNAKSATAYERRTIHSRNPLARLSHRARVAQALSTISLYLPPNGGMLDFGCAKGELLGRVRSSFPQAYLCGLDPFSLGGNGYIHLHSATECAGLSFDLITAFEVLEHLGEAATEEFFALLRDHLSPNGVGVVSTPNMLGPALLPKLLHGAVTTGGSAQNYTTREALRAALLLKAPSRLAPNRSGTMRHKGYDWRTTRVRIAREFEHRVGKTDAFSTPVVGLQQPVVLRLSAALNYCAAATSSGARGPWTAGR